MLSKTIVYSKKVCLLGTFGVGKTSLVRRFVHDLFEDRYLSTIGVQIYQKELFELASGARDDEHIKLILWDLANIEKFNPTIEKYFKGASGAIVVLDLTRPETFEQKNIYINEFLGINPKAQLIFAGNKVDLLENEMNRTDLKNKIEDEYRAPFLFTSAKSGKNVELLFETLAKQLLGHRTR